MLSDVLSVKNFGLNVIPEYELKQHQISLTAICLINT